MTKLLKQVIRIVKKVGNQIRKNKFTVEQKDGFANIVTSADTYCQNQLFKSLKKILPESDFVGEEGNNTGSQRYLWVIDPIDGTANFARGIEEYAISVALFDGGECILGVVYNPVKDVIYYAEKGSSAYRNGKIIKVSNRVFADSLFCTAQSLYNKSLAHLCFEIIEEVYMRVNDTRRFGSCALELCRLAEGTCDIYFEIRVFSWDCSASLFILERAGGVCSSVLSYKFTKNEKPFPVIAANNTDNLLELKRTVEKYLTKEVY